MNDNENYCIGLDDGGSRFLQNVGTYLTKLQGITSQKTIIFGHCHENDKSRISMPN
jgi:hypothetical protein